MKWTPASRIKIEYARSFRACCHHCQKTINHGDPKLKKGSRSYCFACLEYFVEIHKWSLNDIHRLDGFNNLLSKHKLDLISRLSRQESVYIGVN